MCGGIFCFHVCLPFVYCEHVYLSVSDLAKSLNVWAWRLLDGVGRNLVHVLRGRFKCT